MKRFLLVRTKTGDEGTFGHLIHGNFHIIALELPQRDNKEGLSCIPANTYKVIPDTEGKYQYYKILDVPGRKNIEMHPGNWAGDKSKGFKSDLKGCISFGLRRGRLDGQEAILDSALAFSRLKLYIKDEDFELEIIERFAED